MQVQVLSSAQLGRMAQLVRALRLHRRGPRFESLCAHQDYMTTQQLSNHCQLAKTVSETANLAKQLCQTWQGGEIIALSGQLGAGKTTFTQAIGKSLGVKEIITSPTFTILRQYNCHHQTIKQLIHIDAYRLSSGLDLINLGLNDWLNCPTCLIVIEWPEKIIDWLPANTWSINFEHHQTGRLICWQPPQ